MKSDRLTSLPSALELAQPARLRDLRNVRASSPST